MMNSSIKITIGINFSFELDADDALPRLSNFEQALKKAIPPDEMAEVSDQIKRARQLIEYSQKTA